MTRDGSTEPKPTGEPLLVWALYALTATAIFATYARTPVGELYHVTGSGPAAGAGRVLVFLNWSTGLAAMGTLVFAADRGGRGTRVTAVFSLVLCAAIFWPGVVSQDDLDAKSSNAVAAAGVGLAFVLSVRGARPVAFARWARSDRWRVAAAVVVVLVSLPWIAAVLGYGVGGLWAPLGQPRLQQAVHPGEHHGLDGMLLALTALVLSRRIAAVNGRRLRFAARFYCAAMLAYGVANVLNDAWYEQLVKRGVLGWTVPSMILPTPNLAWAILLAAVVALVALVFRADRGARSRTVPAAWALVLVPAVLAGVAVGATHDASVAHETTPAGPQLREDQLVAAIARGPTSHLYALRGDGSGLRQLTDEDAGDAAPDWSPVRRELVFQSGRDGNQEIYAMRLDGTGVRRLTDDGAGDGEPAWSPDGRRIAFVSDRGGNDDVYVMDADGSHVRRLTDDPHADEWPAWSPDGRSIAFDSNRAGTYDLYAVGPGGGPPERLTASAAADRYPRWFPDGGRLAFESDRGGDFGIYMLTLASRRAHPVTGGRGADFGPAVSRDGRWIAFVSDRDGADQLYVVRADGSGPRRLTSELADKGSATWTPP